MDDASFGELLRFFELSWAGYRRVRKGVKKRVARHMEELGLRTIRDYLDLLARDPDAARQARVLLTVSISRFFRDGRLWEALEQGVFPLLERHSVLQGARPIRIWSAGCACGEEAFSLRILWDLARQRSSAMPRLELWATDMNREVLERAKAGVYPKSSLKGLSSMIRDKYFRGEPHGFAVIERLKEGIHWMPHDFVADEPPKLAFDVIFLRNNLFTYFEPAVQVRVLLGIVRVLQPGGFLIVGNREVPPLLKGALRRSASYRCVFEKQSRPAKQS